MLKIKISRNAGFCFGVRRAVEIAEKALEQNNKVHTLGPIIHNPQEVKRLSRCGVKTLKSIDVPKSGCVILRTHGVPFELHEKLKKNKKIHIIDSTCPFVKRAQDIVKKLGSDRAEKDLDVIIVGEKSHPEVVALVSYGNKKCTVIETPQEAEVFRSKKELSIISQTTQTYKNFNDIINILNKKHKTYVYNTICKATLERQRLAEKLAQEVDLMIVVGGKNSGNTTRLAQICSYKTKTYHIESFENLKKSWFKKKTTVGLTAGASTPDWIIKEIELRIKEICKD